MKSIGIYLFLSILLFTMFSCGKEVEQEMEQNPKQTSIEFDNLEIGDIMLYSYLKGQACWDNSPCEITYTGDTLELKVIDNIAGKFLIRESITPGSAIFASETKYIVEAEEKYELLWDIRNDSLIISSSEPDNSVVESHLLRKLKFPLIEINENKTEFNGWQTTLPSNEVNYDFYIENGELLGITYPHLNGIQINSPMAFDGDGTTHIYNKESGIVRITSISAWTGAGRGWDRIN